MPGECEVWVSCLCLDGRHDKCEGHPWDEFCGCDCHWDLTALEPGGGGT